MISYHQLRPIIGFALGVFSTIFLMTTWSNISVMTSYKVQKANKDETLILIVTPTVQRPTRLADMTRFSNTLSHLKSIYWLVIEDGNSTFDYVERILNRTNLSYTYVAESTPPNYVGRGRHQRNFALAYIRNNWATFLSKHKNCVLYFADDDNSYDLRLFNEYIRNVKKLGMWAVGLVAGPMESLMVQDGKVVAYRSRYKPNRAFAVDMAGFAVNLKYVLESTAIFNPMCQQVSETCFLEEMNFTKDDIEPFGHHTGTKRELYVWHTRTEWEDIFFMEPELNGFIFERSIPKPNNQLYPG